jgi:hypothetical protein
MHQLHAGLPTVTQLPFYRLTMKWMDSGSLKSRNPNHACSLRLPPQTSSSPTPVNHSPGRPTHAASHTSPLKPRHLNRPLKSRREDDPRVIDRLQYKSRTSFSDNRRTHVWVVEVDRPQPLQLTSGPFYDHAVDFSPRGDEILFLSNHEPDPGCKQQFRYLRG